jgi:PAS domain S-box-containing protein
MPRPWLRSPSKARAFLGVDAAAICWWRPDEQRLVCLASTEPGEVASGLALRPDESPAGLAFNWQRAMVVEDPGASEAAALWPALPRTRTLAAVPLPSGGRAAGVLVVRTYLPYHYEVEHTRFLTLLAAQVGPSIEAARLRGQALLALAPPVVPGERVPARSSPGALAPSQPSVAPAPDPGSTSPWAPYQAMTCGVLVSDEAGVILHANEAAERLLGRCADEVCGQPLDAVLAFTRDDGGVASPEQHPAAQARRTGRPVRECIVSFQRGDGAQRWLQLDVVPVASASGTPARLVLSFVDVTVRREAERQLQAYAQTEKLRALGQMASGVAHDLNQYLGLVAGHGELALRTLGRPDPDWASVQEAVQVMAQAALDGADTVKRLLAFARPRQEGPGQRLAVGDLLREVARLTAPRWRDAAQAQGRRISLHVEAEPDATIDGWPESLREVFTNLVFNAVDALPHGGTIRLATWRRGPQTIVEVQDSGIGMSLDVQARVFEPFFSTKGERGTGLGLAMVYGIVERHGGQIAVDSAPGRGTTFRLTFPWARAAQAPTQAPAEPGGPRALHILVVDDEAMLGRMAARMLAVDGHTAAVATSGEEALQLLCAEDFDLVISDVGMGEGMNGWELAHRVRAEFPDVRFALATGWGAQIEPDEARARGVGAVIGKPYSLRDLRYLLNAA